MQQCIFDNGTRSSKFPEPGTGTLHTMRERQDGDTRLFERKEHLVFRLLSVALLLASVAAPWLYDYPYELWFPVMPLMFLLLPALELRVSSASVTLRRIWWIPGLGNVGTAGRRIPCSQIGQVSMARRKIGSSSTGSDTMKWTPTLRGEQRQALWSFDSTDRAKALCHRLGELLDVPVVDEYGTVQKRPR